VQVPIALQMAKQAAETGRAADLLRKIKNDEFMKCAVTECYESLKRVLMRFIVGDIETRLIDGLFDEVDVNVEKDSLLDNFKLGELPVLSAKFIELLELLEMNHADKEAVDNARDLAVLKLQDMYEVVTRDMMSDTMRYSVYFEWHSA
jgi:callose synthase